MHSSILQLQRSVSGIGYTIVPGLYAARCATGACKPDTMRDVRALQKLSAVLIEAPLCRDYAEVACSTIYAHAQSRGSAEYVGI